MDIKIIKRKGDPINPTFDADNNCNYYESEKLKNDKRNCTTSKYDTNVQNNNNTKVPSNDSLCGKSKSKFDCLETKMMRKFCSYFFYCELSLG